MFYRKSYQYLLKNYSKSSKLSDVFNKCKRCPHIKEVKTHLLDLFGVLFFGLLTVFFYSEFRCPIYHQEILEFEKSKATLEYQYYMINEFIVSYSRLLYLMITLVFFFSTLPSTIVEYILFCGPVLLFYILISCLKKSLKWYFDFEMKRNCEKLAELHDRKKNILSEVKVKMKFKDAKDIIEEYSCVKNQIEDFESQNKNPELCLLRKRGSSVDSVVKYVLNEEKENALICKYCNHHNGMALKEEFNYISFRCCRCLKLNEAKSPPVKKS